MTDIHEIAVELAADADVPRAGRRTVLRMAWRTDDPFAVELTVSAQPDHPSLPRGRWVVLRDFLRYGLEESTGDGDVRICPAGARVLLRLSRHGRPCDVTVSADSVRTFLDDTEVMVPSGSESSDVAIEALLDRLLDH